MRLLIWKMQANSQHERSSTEWKLMPCSSWRNIEEAHQTIKDYFRDRSAEQARAVVEEWKSENIYPYEGEAKSPIETAERKVFDIVASSVNDYLQDFAAAPPKSKARFTFACSAPPLKGVRRICS